MVEVVHSAEDEAPAHPAHAREASAPALYPLVGDHEPNAGGEGEAIELQEDEEEECAQCERLQTPERRLRKR